MHLRIAHQQAFPAAIPILCFDAVQPSSALCMQAAAEAYALWHSRTILAIFSAFSGNIGA
ncbi:hypothetical protein [Acinetobacter sp. WCHAc010034]|uniref:hypothetical protein n=1 Tax=Acinetobacter sp. WCHAc010034 TaxID=1879049 RepID=UPI0013C367E7|nr:hypothetical protein [Acinetobacter sp. WCHAc010034]